MEVATSILAGAVALVLLGFGLHRLALWAERRGWLFYRNTRPRFRGSTIGTLEEIYNPAMHHVIEERDTQRGSGEQQDSGDTPEPGSGGPGDFSIRRTAPGS